MLDLIYAFVGSETSFCYIHLSHLSQAKWKPLHTYALAGHIKFMDGLLEKGYDIEQVDKVRVFQQNRILTPILKH